MSRLYRLTVVIFIKETATDWKTAVALVSSKTS